MMNENGKVLIASPVHEVLLQGLEAAGYSCVAKTNIVQAEAPALVQSFTGIITSTRLLLDRALLDAAPLLRWVGRMGSGMEIIDVDYAAQKGIALYSSPEGNRNAVAEHALGMLLALNKRIVKSHNEINEGIWLRDENRGEELEGKTIGIIGFGNTGRAFAKKLLGFDMNILVYDTCYENIPPYVTCCDDLDSIYQEADIISFHVPLLASTMHYFNNVFLESMQKPFVLLNTSRGKVIDSEALLGGILSGKIRGACLDVWEEEPLEKMSAQSLNIFNDIMKMPSVIVTSHIAGYSVEALYKMSKVLLEKIVMKP